MIWGLGLILPCCRVVEGAPGAAHVTSSVGGRDDDDGAAGARRYGFSAGRLRWQWHTGQGRGGQRRRQQGRAFSSLGERERGGRKKIGEMDPNRRRSNGHERRLIVIYF